MILYRPSHAQLRHHLLRNVDIEDAACSTTSWEVHLVSFRLLLARIAHAQRQRYPQAIVAYPPERKSFPMHECPYGFQLLIIRFPDLATHVPEIGGLPSQEFSARALTGGCTERILVVDGWAGSITGLLTFLPHTLIQLDGTLAGIEPSAWQVINELEVVLDATGMIRDLRGPVRGRYDQEGWTGIPGLRRASGRYRAASQPPSSDASDGMVDR
jgi:hypothetical protein